MNRFQLRHLLGCLAVALAISSASARLEAQDLGSTLIRLTERSDAIFKVRVLDSRERGGERRVRFKVQHTLKGRVKGHTTAAFTLTETARRACGQALHGVLVGAGYLVFLTQDAGRVRLTAGSSRALVPADPDILAHVRALLDARSDRERLSLLTANLRSRNDRVRGDAAMALPLRRGLEKATRADRDRVLAALGATLGRDDRTALSLIQTVSRLRLRAAVPALLNDYLADESPSLRRVFVHVIPALDAAYAVDQIGRRQLPNVRGQMRAIEMLAHCPGRQAGDCLQRFAQSRNRAISASAAQAISVQVTADRENIVDPAHVFRSISPSSRR